jgi:small-conductance mechanosensitive channel/CRP-like cAMP-binding protein
MLKFAVRLLVFAACATAALRADAVLGYLGVDAGPATLGAGRALLQSIAWIAGAFVAMSAVNLLFWDGVIARIARRPVPSLLKSVSSAVLLTLALTGIVAIVLDRDVTGIWATSGAIGLVLGFALRSVIQDIFSGIFMNIDGSIKAGDWVALHHQSLQKEVYGRVLEIAWRTCRVQLENNNVIVVPNGMLGTMAVTNFAHADHTSRLETEIVLDFDVPPERARRILLSGAHAAIGTRGVLADPPPAVMVGEPTDRGITYKVRFWGKVSENSPSKMIDSVMTELLGQLRIAGLTPAFPKEDITFEPRPKRLLEHERVADRVEVLSRIELFGRSLEPAELEALATGLAVESWMPGAALVRQGAAGDSLFVVVEGTLEVRVDREDGGGTVVVNRVVPGEIFGEMSLLTGEPRSATVVAVTSVLAYEVRQEHVEALLSARPAIAEQMSALVAEHRVRTDAATRVASTAERHQARLRLKEQILVKMQAAFSVAFGSRVARAGRLQAVGGDGPAA